MNIYDVCCHGCGKVYTIQATHFSCTESVTIKDGKSYSCRACEDCMKDGDRVNRAYNAIMDDTFEEFKKENWNEED